MRVVEDDAKRMRRLLIALAEEPAIRAEIVINDNEFSFFVTATGDMAQERLVAETLAVELAKRFPAMFDMQFEAFDCLKSLVTTAPNPADGSWPELDKAIDAGKSILEMDLKEQGDD